MKIFYEANAHATGGRSGKVTTDDGALALQLTIPQGMGGPGGEGTNPEQLFAAGYAACFDNALNYMARQRKIDLVETSVDARVGIGQKDAGSFGLAVTLTVRIIGVPHELAEELLHAADAGCPYSNAIRNNVDVQLVLNTEESPV
jgi:Ohr subfamily peroxiredoxin